VNLADVVEKYAGQQQVAVDLGIVPGDEVARAKKRDHVVQQAANIGVMQGLGGGSVAVSGGELRVGHEGPYQRLEMRILEGCDEVRQRLPEFVNILGGLGKIVRELDL
jgi:hypothetical protein